MRGMRAIAAVLVVALLGCVPPPDPAPQGPPPPSAEAIRAEAERAREEAKAKAERLARARVAAERFERELKADSLGRHWIREVQVNDLAPEILMVAVPADAWAEKAPLGRSKTLVWLQRQWARVNADECPGEKRNHCELWIYVTEGLRPERVAWSDALGGVHLE